MRPAPFVLGALALAAAWLSPVPDLIGSPFSAHMAIHVTVVAVAAPLLALGLAGGRLDPVVRAPALFPPVPWSVVELIAVWAWHTPALHHAARHSALGGMAEQATFLACGLAVWLAAFGGDPRARADRTGAGLLALLLTSMHMTLLGALLALSPRPLYDHAGGGELAPLDDQHLGGALMLAVGGASYLLGGLVLAARLLAGARRAAPGGGGAR